MIPAIGMMIGAYIITRMLAMMLDKNTHVVARVFAGLTIPFTLLMLVMLIGSGITGSTPPGLR